MPPKRKEAAAKNKNEAPPAKTTKGEKKIESEKTPSVLPDQGTSGGMAAFKPLAKPVEELDAEQFSQFLEQNTELLKLFSNLQGQGYDEVLRDMERWIRFYEFNALASHFIAGPDKKKNEFYIYMKPPTWLNRT